MAWMGRGGRTFGAGWLLAGAGGCAGSGGHAAAQDQSPKTVAPSAQELTGRDFAGVRFRLPVVSGKLSFRADKAWSWDEGAARRLVLEGGVVVEMGGYRFSAKRAAAWLESVTGAPGRETRQVFIYFEELGSAGDPAGGVSMTSDRLPVRGVIEADGGIELKTDLLTAKRPTGAEGEDGLIGEAEGALRKSLQRELGIEEARRAGPGPHLSRKSPFVRAPKPAAPPTPQKTATTQQPDKPGPQQARPTARRWRSSRGSRRRRRRTRRMPR